MSTNKTSREPGFPPRAGLPGSNAEPTSYGMDAALPYALGRELSHKIEAGLDASHRIETRDADEWDREIAAARLAGDWDRVVFLHGSRAWLDVFEAHAAEMPDATYWRLLVRIYSTYDTVAWAEERFLAMFRDTRPGREAAMDTFSREDFESLPHEVRIYRGYAGPVWPGLSWTLSRRIATFFAYRAQDRSGQKALQPTVMRGLVLKSDILTVVSSRGEREVVVDPQLVRAKRRLVLGPLKGDIESLII